MRPSRAVSQGVFCMVCFGLFPLVVSAENKENARASFGQGIRAFNEGKYTNSRDLFLKAYGDWPHSKIALCLSIACVKLDAKDQAKKFARAALDGSPYPTEGQKRDALIIVAWAEGYPQLRGWMGIPPLPPQQLPEGDVLEDQKLLAVNLTGEWSCNDGGRYYIRHLGNRIWWYGESPEAGKWSNVFSGLASDSSVVGDWADVPRGGAKNSGHIGLRLTSRDELRMESSTGSFSGSMWQRKSK